MRVITWNLGYWQHTSRHDEACNLLEAGFEYVTDMDSAKIFRKRK